MAFWLLLFTRLPEEFNSKDGAGWLAGRSDLEKLYRGCDFCLSIYTLGSLDAVVLSHVPEQYFTKREKPNVEIV